MRMTKVKTGAALVVLIVLTLCLLPVSGDTRATETIPQTTTQTKESQAAMTPQKALQMLQAGNKRFYEGRFINRDSRAEIKATAKAQYPYAAILSCMDSRTSSDLLFDLRKGDAFSIRLAGNIVNEDVIGGMEFATKVSGAKLIAVIGHTNCGAIKGACDNAQLGSLTSLLGKINPAVQAVPASVQPRNSSNNDFVEQVAKQNVLLALQQIKDRSSILKEMIDSGQIGLVGGMYDLETGKVQFYGEPGAKSKSE